MDVEEWGQVDLPGRLYFRRSRPEKPRARLLALHGYAENPTRILAALARPALGRIEVVAPLGPHQFYNRAGEVVGSWMTRFRREDQIDALLRGLERVVAAIDGADGPLPWFAFGFSQGAATAHRLRVLSDLPLNRVFALAGDMPPEVRANLASRDPRRLDIHWGESDDRVAPAVLQGDVEAYQAAGWPVSGWGWPGGHDYLPGAVDAIAQQILADLD